MGSFTLAARTAFCTPWSSARFLPRVDGSAASAHLSFRAKSRNLSMQMAQVPSTPIKDALQSAAPIEPVRVQGWVRTRRDSKDFSFIELNDGSSLRNLQIIAKDA